MKKLLSLCLCFVLSIQVFSVPPKPQQYYYKQKDGTTVVLTLHGNERESFYTTQDGKVVQFINGKGMVYLYEDKGELKASNWLAHDSENRSLEEKKFLRQNPLTLEEAFSFFEEKKLEGNRIKMFGNIGNGLGRYKESGKGTVRSIGKHDIPIILAEFADVHFMPMTTKEKISRQLNEKDYHDEPLCKGSVRDFFIKQSDSLFQPNFEVVAKVRVSKNRDYYGQNKIGGRDKNILEFVKEAIDSAASKGVKFSKYAEDKDNNAIPLVGIIFAGQGEADSRDSLKSNYIWPHHWSGIKKSRSGYTIAGGEVSVNSYFVGNELVRKRGKDYLNGMNIFVHEFGHSLGLPDFYTTGGGQDDFPTMGLRDQMDVGCYLNGGYTPIAYTTYERSYLGWTQVTSLTQPGEYRIYPYGSGHSKEQAYVIYPEGKENGNEYYLLEYRKVNSYSPYFLGEGLLVLHVDYNSSIWQRNQVNNEKGHLRMAYVAADNEMQNYPPLKADKTLDWHAFTTDVYDGKSAHDSLTANSSPAMFFYTPNAVARPIFNIKKHKEGYLTFSFLRNPLSGIQDSLVDPRNEKVLGIYTIDGHRVRVENVKELPKGVYVEKTSKGSRKIIK